LVGSERAALITAPVATRLIQSYGVLSTFAYLGVAFLIVTVTCGYFMQNPPDDWKPEGWTPTAAQVSQRSSRDYTLGKALRTWQWWALWLLLFLNTSAGISVISQEAPLFQELAGVSAVIAAGMIGVSEHRQRFRKSVLGLGIRFAHTTSDVHRNVRGPGGAVLRPSRNELC